MHEGNEILTIIIVGSFSSVAPSTHKAMKHPYEAAVPSLYTPASSPSIPFHKENHARTKINSPGSSLSPSPSEQQGIPFIVERISSWVLFMVYLTL